MTVAVKHNTAFTALLPEISRYYPLFAIIRNPVWTLASWNSIQFPAYEGHIPMAEQLDRELAQALAKIPDRLDRQIYILSWMFERYTHLQPQHVISYENMIATSGQALTVIVPEAARLSEVLSRQNKPERYPHVSIPDLRDRLLKKGGAFLNFYSRQQLLSD
jgi:hypothetical protein